MATLTVQEPTLAGITPSYASCAGGGDVFPVTGGKYLIHLKNSGTQKVVTIATAGTVEGIAIADPTVTVPATTGDKMTKIEATTLFVDSNGQIALTYDGVTGLTVAILKV